eukprot:m.10713 g.10713  ORF g.10713 m.10713 type:complete len:68 (+) comp2772_c0_seq1:251-454(+)
MGMTVPAWSTTVLSFDVLTVAFLAPVQDALRCPGVVRDTVGELACLDPKYITDGCSQLLHVFEIAAA